MSNEPRIEHRPARRTLAIEATTSMQQEAKVVVSTMPRLQAWLASRRLQADGPPFVRYRRIDMPHRLDIEVGVPVATAAEGDGEVVAGELPAGRYAVLVHTGPTHELVEANAVLQKWAQEQQVDFDVQQEGSSSIWAARLETSLTDPAAEPDPRSRRTEIAYLLA